MISNIVIIEDEKLNADRLKRLIREILPAVSIATVVESVSDSICWFENNGMPDVVMMDVRLSDGLSFDIFRKVSITCPVIFTTAYDEYAVQAFKHNGIDYLLKPIVPEELEAALNKAAKSTAVHDGKTIENLISLLRPKEFRKRFLLPYRDGYKAILVQDVKYISVDYGLTHAFLYDSSEVPLPHTLEELEQQFDPQTFFRANRQYIINIDAVAEVRNYFNGKLKVFMKGTDQEIIVSKGKALALKTWLDS
jgi:two-component system response regulator LytT